MWLYDELYSCPLIVILGSFKHEGYYGWSVLPVASLRVSLLRRSGEWRVVSNIREALWFERSLEACRSIIKGSTRTGFIELDLAVNASLYGGFGIYTEIQGDIRPVTLEVIDTSVFKFYLKPKGKPREPSEGSLSDWILLGLGLREGLWRLVADACSRLGRVTEESCIIEGDLGEVAITAGIFSEAGWLRVIPDNTPLRHVVAYTSTPR
ncbi:MAG: hypothetical protein OWQ48_07005 [Desulfurococcus sp.]|nr:hypothetical protein [Desulfurococcus sp.]